MSPAGQALFGYDRRGYVGLGDLLRDQVSDETDEISRRRLQQVAADNPALNPTLGGPVSGMFYLWAVRTDEPPGAPSTCLL